MLLIIRFHSAERKKKKFPNLRYTQNSIINQILLGDEGAQRRDIFIYFSTLFYGAKILLEYISRRGCYYERVREIKGTSATWNGEKFKLVAGTFLMIYQTKNIIIMITKISVKVTKYSQNLYIIILNYVLEMNCWLPIRNKSWVLSIQ